MLTKSLAQHNYDASATNLATDEYGNNFHFLRLGSIVTTSFVVNIPNARVYRMSLDYNSDGTQRSPQYALANEWKVELFINSQLLQTVVTSRYNPSNVILDIGSIGYYLIENDEVNIKMTCTGVKRISLEDYSSSSFNVSFGGIVL